MILLSLLLQAAGPAVPASVTDKAHFDKCVETATTDGEAGKRAAAAWLLEGGTFLARQCLGMAHSTAGEWPQAAATFEEAARAAEIAKDKRAPNYWAQAGNAWLAAGDAAKARGDLDAALAVATLAGLERGEAELDRARALVLVGELPAARVSLDRALGLAAADPLAWLLSATLARRTDDLLRAKKDIAEALRLSSDDASVQLEAGNVAARTGDEAGAKLAWTAAARIGAGTPIADQAKAALEQFD